MGAPRWHMSLFGNVAVPTGGLFGAPAEISAVDDAGDGDAGETLEEDCSAEFTPLVQLSQQQVCSGEEDEDVVFEMRAKAFRFGEDVGGDRCWKERGKGQLKLLKNKENGKVRVLLRVDKTRKIRLNHFIYESYELQPNPTNDCAWVYFATDFSDECPNESKICIKFGSVENAAAWKEQWDKVRATLATAGDDEDEEKAEEEV